MCEKVTEDGPARRSACRSVKRKGSYGQTVLDRCSVTSGRRQLQSDVNYSLK